MALRFSLTALIERAECYIDFKDGPDGTGFKVDNPNAPKPVEDISLRRKATARREAQRY